MGDLGYILVASLRSDGKAGHTADGLAARLGCLCRSWGCCFYDEYGDPVTCEQRCEHMCYDQLGAAAATGPYGTLVDCDYGSLEDICPPRLPCDACDNDPMPRVVVVSGVSCDGCSIDCTGLPPSSYCWWRSAEKQFMADQLSGSHVLSLVSACYYAKQWEATFYHPTVGNRVCSFRVAVSFSPSGDQWLGILGITAWNTGFSTTTAYVSNPANQPCGSFTGLGDCPWADCADYLANSGGDHTVLCLGDAHVSW